jgi:IS66 C-terminal element
MATPSGLRECANAKKPKLLADLFHDTLKDVYAAVKATLIMTAKLNDVDPQAWLADVLARIASIPQGRLHELLPWEWQKANELKEAAA